MKQLFCLILSILMIVPVSGCQNQELDIRHTFYYPRADFGYNTQEGKFHNSIIESEIRRDISDQAVDKVLDTYLDGPIKQTLANPFSENLSVESVNIDGQTLSIVVSDHLSELTGISLMIACACLGKTGMELTNTSSAQISCLTELLDGKKSMIFHKDTIIFSDMAASTAGKQE